MLELLRGHRAREQKERARRNGFLLHFMIREALRNAVVVRHVVTAVYNRN